MKKTNLMFLVGSALLLNSFAAQAGTTHLNCTPVGKNAHWFSSLTFDLGREGQVGGTYSGFETDDAKSVKSFGTRNDDFDSNLTSEATAVGTTINLFLDGYDQFEFHLALSNSDTTATLTGQAVFDCTDGKETPLNAEVYSCTAAQ